MKIQKSDIEWKAILAAKNAESVAFDVTRKAATERPFSGKYEDHWNIGTYHCICCDALLFEANTKFDAGCGWPSFSQAAEPSAITENRDSPTEWCAWRQSAANAVPTWAMCFRMDPLLRVFAIA